MFLEFNWMVGLYQFRFGDRFTDVGGTRSVESLKEARWVLKASGLKLGRKTDSRTWAIVAL